MAPLLQNIRQRQQGRFDFFWQPPLPILDLAKAKQLLAEAGHRNGFDASEFYCDSSYSNVGEAVLDNLQAAGIRLKLRPLERPPSSRHIQAKNSKT